MLDMYTFDPVEAHIPQILIANDRWLNVNAHIVVASACLSYSTDLGHIAWQPPEQSNTDVVST